MNLEQLQNIHSNVDKENISEKRENLRFVNFDEATIQEYRGKMKKIRNFDLIAAQDAVWRYERMIETELKNRLPKKENVTGVINQCELHHIMSGSTPAEEGCKYSDFEDEELSFRRFLDVLSGLNPKKFKKNEDGISDYYNFEAMTDQESAIFENNKELFKDKLRELKKKTDDLENIPFSEIKDKGIKLSEARKKLIINFIEELAKVQNN